MGNKSSRGKREKYHARGDGDGDRPANPRDPNDHNGGIGAAAPERLGQPDAVTPPRHVTPQRDEKVRVRRGKPCPYFLSGYCRDGSECRMLHSEVEPAAAAVEGGGSGGGSGAGNDSSPSSPSKTPTRVKIKSEEQAVLLAMLHSLRDSLRSAQTHKERAAIYTEMKKTAEQFKAEQERIRGERRHQNRGDDSRARSLSLGSHSSSGALAERPSPLRNVNFPTFPYCSDRHGGAGRESDSEDRIECAICIAGYEDAEEILVLPCLHWFHAKCALQWLEKKTECPLCQCNILASLEHPR